MSINWRDTVAIIAIIFVISALVTTISGLLSIADWRAATLLLILLGGAIYVILGPRFLPTQEPWLSVSVTLHTFAVIVAALALIIGQLLSFAVLGLTLVVLWIIATVYHVRIGDDKSRRAH